MKKIIGFLLFMTFAFSAFGAAETSLGVSATVKNGPQDITGYNLHTRNSAASLDTFATTIQKVYGPYSLAKSDGSPMAKGFQIMADVITGTTPVAQFAYQIISGKTMKDTVSSWVAACTLGTGAINSYFDISSKAGESIVFKVNNYDGSETQIPGLLKVYMKDAATYTKTTN